MRRWIAPAVGLAIAATFASPASAGVDPITVVESCVGTDHTPPYVDQNTGERLDDSASVILVAVALVAAPERATVRFALVGPNGEARSGTGTVGPDGRVEAPIPINQFGTYTAQEPIAVLADGEQIATIPPEEVFLGGVVEVDQDEVACDRRELPPGQVATTDTPAPGPTGPTAAITASPSAPASPIAPGEPATAISGQGGKLPWIAIILIALILLIAAVPTGTTVSSTPRQA